MERGEEPRKGKPAAPNVNNNNGKKKNHTWVMTSCNRSPAPEMLLSLYTLFFPSRVKRKQKPAAYFKVKLGTSSDLFFRLCRFCPTLAAFSLMLHQAGFLNYRCCHFNDPLGFAWRITGGVTAKSPFPLSSTAKCVSLACASKSKNNRPPVVMWLLGRGWEAWVGYPSPFMQDEHRWLTGLA